MVDFFPREGGKQNTNQPWPLPLPSAFISQAMDGELQEQGSTGPKELKELLLMQILFPPPQTRRYNRIFKSLTWELDRFEFASRSCCFLTLWSLTSYLHFLSRCFHICKTGVLIVPTLFLVIVKSKWVGLPCSQSNIWQMLNYNNKSSAGSPDVVLTTIVSALQKRKPRHVKVK